MDVSDDEEPQSILTRTSQQWEAMQLYADIARLEQKLAQVRERNRQLLLRLEAAGEQINSQQQELRMAHTQIAAQATNLIQILEHGPDTSATGIPA